jgi:hypothetical protein
MLFHESFTYISRELRYNWNRLKVWRSFLLFSNFPGKQEIFLSNRKPISQLWYEDFKDFGRRERFNAN